MCGRFTRFQSWAEIHALYGLTTPLPDPETAADFRPRYNIAPGQPAPVIIEDQPHQLGARLMRWGLVPGWAENEQIGFRMINARSETVTEKAAFKAPFARQRCIVPASGYYEWKVDAGLKVPHHIQRADNRLMHLAGLWDRWQSPEGDEVLSFTILTCPPNRTMADIHDRMPVILDMDAVYAWLNPDADKALLQALMQPCPDDWLSSHAVSERVNKVGVDNPGLIEKVAVQASLF